MNVIICSPLRVGSTWVHELIVTLLAPNKADYVDTVDEAVSMAESGATCVLKSHNVSIALAPQLRRRFHTVRVLRNFKDCLISRALYCRNVRSEEGLSNQPDEQLIIERCKHASDEEFIREFFTHFPRLDRWIEQVVAFECGPFDHTFYYEMLLHNVHDELCQWLQKTRLGEITHSHVNNTIKACSFQKMKSRKTKGFIGSTGVGRWMHVLDDAIVEKLDIIYYSQRNRIQNSQLQLEQSSLKP